MFVVSMTITTQLMAQSTGNYYTVPYGETVGPTSLPTFICSFKKDYTIDYSALTTTINGLWSDVSAKSCAAATAEVDKQLATCMRAAACPLNSTIKWTRLDPNNGECTEWDSWNMSSLVSAGGSGIVTAESIGASYSVERYNGATCETTNPVLCKCSFDCSSTQMPSKHETILISMPVGASCTTDIRGHAYQSELYDICNKYRDRTVYYANSFRCW